MALFLAVFLIGLGMGSEVDIIAYLTSRYFGLHEVIYTSPRGLAEKIIEAGRDQIPKRKSQLAV